jgi:protein YibB
MTTIVTAFADIGRGTWEGTKNNIRLADYLKRDNQTYLKRFQKLAQLNNPIICFTQPKFFDFIKNLNENIVLISIDWIWDTYSDLIQKISQIQKKTDFLDYVDNPSCPEYWSCEYVLINFLKSFFVQHAIEQNLVETNSVAWIDFGYCRDEVYCPEGKYWDFDPEGKINLFCQKENVYEKPIFNLVKTGEVYIQGCHIVAPKAFWSKLAKLVSQSLSSLLEVGLVDDDQTLLLMAYRKNPEIFKLNKANPNNWFVIFKDKCK